MRISTYVIGAPLPNQPFFILMHGFTGAVDKVSLSVGQYLIEHRGQPLDSSDHNLKDLSTKEIASLIKRGYLTELEQSAEKEVMVKIATSLHEVDLSTSSPSFTFIPTYRCNLRCPYCFQSHDMHAGHGQYGIVLSKERVNQAFKIIDKYSATGSVAKALKIVEGQALPNNQNNISYSRIGLFGGEPLLEVTKEIVTYIVKCSNERGRSVSAITNGVELDKFKDLLGPKKIEWLQITLDGEAKFHDRRRIGPGFPKTFEKIIENIDMALQQGVQIDVRINIDTTNLPDIPALTEYFINQGWNNNPNFAVHAAVVTKPIPHKSLITQDQLVTVTTAISNDKFENLASYESYAKDTLTRCLLNKDYPFKRVAHCSAEVGQIMFDALGDVYTCWEEIGIKERRIAVYDENGINFDPRVAGEWLARFPGAIDQCASCPYALIHTSGCAIHARNSTGTIFSSACESFQGYFPRTLANAYVEIERKLLGEEELAIEEIKTTSQKLRIGDFPQILVSDIQIINRTNVD